MIGEIITRSQHARKGKSGNSGPDRYMVIVWRKDDSEAVGSHPLSEANIAKYSWEVEYIGEYYGRSMGPKSLYANCMNYAVMRLSQGPTNDMKDWLKCPYCSATYAFGEQLDLMLHVRNQHGYGSTGD